MTFGRKIKCGLISVGGLLSQPLAGSLVGLFPKYMYTHTRMSFELEEKLCAYASGKEGNVCVQVILEF